jgi:hypothetical protein
MLYLDPCGALMRSQVHDTDHESDEHNLWHYTMHVVWHCIMPHDATCTICYISVCSVYDSHILHGASQSACCCKSNTCSIPIVVTLCDASDGIVREHARGTWDVVPSDTMLSQHATCNIRHVHMVRRKQVMVPYPCDMVPHVTWCKTNRTPRCWLMPGRAGCLCC